MIPLFSLLPDTMIEWIAEASTERRLATHEVIIREGQKPRALFIVLEGVLGIYPSLDGPQVALAGPGSVLGDMSILDDGPASAAVKAEEACLVLELPREMLQQKLRQDGAFASEFYRAVAIVLSQRVREANRHHLIAHLRESTRPQVDPVSRAMEDELGHFKETMVRMDHALLRKSEVTPEEYADFASSMDHLVNRSHELLGAESGIGDDARDRIGARLQREVLPYILTTETAERLYAKPRGYAGDYLTIQNIYQNQPAGTGRLGPLFDRHFLTSPPALAIRHRRAFMSEYLAATLARAEGGPVSILCMASGPAMELFDAILKSGMRDRVKATLVDIDLQALAFVDEMRSRLRLEQNVDLVNQNLIALALGHGPATLGQFDLVYSVGLADYLNNKLLTRLLAWVHQQLVPGGKVVLCNFDPRNTAREFLGFVLDWHIIHRSEEELKGLFHSALYRRAAVRVLPGSSPIDCYVECVKEQADQNLG